MHQGINKLDSKLDLVTDSQEVLGTVVQEVREMGLTIVNAMYVFVQDRIRGEKMIGEYDPGPGT